MSIAHRATPNEKRARYSMSKSVVGIPSDSASHSSLLSSPLPCYLCYYQSIVLRQSPWLLHATLPGRHAQVALVRTRDSPHRRDGRMSSRSRGTGSQSMGGQSNTSPGSLGGGVTLTVTSAASAFFSGEKLEFSITFTNTRTPSSSRRVLASDGVGNGGVTLNPRHTSSNRYGHKTTQSVYSAPASRQTFSPVVSDDGVHNSNSSGGESLPTPRLVSPGAGGLGTAGTGRSYIDLTNSSATSSHLVLPERQGIIGTPLALLPSSSRSSSPATTTSFPSRSHSPIDPRRRPAHGPQSTSSRSHPAAAQQQQQQQQAALYSQKRLPTTAKHKKNDYSVAISSYDGNPSGRLDAQGDNDVDEEGVSDLSSQLAGLALLQERGSRFDSPEASPIDPLPYVDEYRRKSEAAAQEDLGFLGPNSRGESPHTVGQIGVSQAGYHRSSADLSCIRENVLTSLHPSVVSTASDSSTDAGPIQTNARRFTPTRSLSAHSVATDSTAATRVPSSASTAFQAMDEGNSTRNSIDFYGLGRNESVDSVLRDTMTSYATRARPPFPPSRQVSRHALPHLKPPGPHARSASAASSPVPHSVPSRPLTPSYTTVEDDDGTETLLWAFAQFSGSFTVEEALVKSADFVAVKRNLFGAGQGKKNVLSPTFNNERVVGGGSLESDAMSETTATSGWKDWIWGTSSNNKPASGSRRTSAATQTTSTLPADPALDGSVRRRSSAAVVAGVPTAAPTVGSLEDRRNKAMNDNSVPVFSSPPSILAVDLVLEPGESKTCKPACLMRSI